MYYIRLLSEFRKETIYLRKRELAVTSQDQQPSLSQIPRIAGSHGLSARKLRIA